MFFSATYPPETGIWDELWYILEPKIPLERYIESKDLKLEGIKQIILICKWQEGDNYGRNTKLNYIT